MRYNVYVVRDYIHELYNMYENNMTTRMARGIVKKVKMLRIDDATHDRLKKYGQFGDSFQDILNRLMDMAETQTQTESKATKKR